VVDIFLIGWLSVLLGIILATWPFSFWSWGLVVGFTFFVRERTVLVLALALGLLRASSQWFGPIEIDSLATDRTEKTFEIKIVDSTSFGSLAELTSANGVPRSSPSFVRISKPLNVGHFYRVRAELLPLSTYEVELGLSKERRMMNQNVLGKLRLRGGDPVELIKEPSLRDRWREVIFQWLESPFQALSGFKRALVLGDTNGIPPQIWSSMNYLGLSHFVVMDGSHLALMIFLFSLLARRLCRFFRCRTTHPWFRLLVILMTVIFFFLCSPDTSLLRALMVFMIVSALAPFFPFLLRYKPTERLAAIGTVFALVNPMSALTPSYALSFGAAYGILRPGEWPDPSPRILKILFPYFLISPICFVFGLIVHPLSPILNLLIFPVFVFLIFPVAVCSKLIPFGDPCADFLVRTFYTSMNRTSAFLQMHTSTTKWPAYFIIPILISTVVLFALRPIKFKIRFLSLSILFLTATMGSLLWYPFQHSERKGVEISVLDVGQGDALFISMEDKKIVIDGGGPALGTRQLFPALLNKFGNWIDLWVLTHFDRDHRGNFQEIGGLIRPQNIWIPRFDASVFSAWIKDSFPTRSIFEIERNPLRICSQNYCLESWIWHRRLSEKWENLRVGNEDCIVLQLKTRSTGILLGLFLGDLPREGERAFLQEVFGDRAENPVVQSLALLKAGHHGSRTSTSEDLVAFFRPEVALITSGRENQFHFPHAETIDRLERWGTKIFRVDELGSFNVQIREGT